MPNPAPEPLGDIEYTRDPISRDELRDALFDLSVHACPEIASLLEKVDRLPNRAFGVTIALHSRSLRVDVKRR